MVTCRIATTIKSDMNIYFANYSQEMCRTHPGRYSSTILAAPHAYSLGAAYSLVIFHIEALQLLPLVQVSGYDTFHGLPPGGCVIWYTIQHEQGDIGDTGVGWWLQGG